MREDPTCPTCGGQVKTKTQYVSLWVRAWGAGTGEVRKVPVSWCSRCDPEPDERGIAFYEELADGTALKALSVEEALKITAEQRMKLTHPAAKRKETTKN